MTVSARRRTASDQVSAALIHAAETVLDRDGSAAVTVRAVAREADVAPMGVYNRFANKEGLLSELAIRAFDQLAVAIEVDTEAGPTDRLRQGCNGYRNFALKHPARYSLIFASGSPAGDPHSAARARGHAVFETLVSMVAAVAGAEEDDAVEAAHAVWAAVHGAVTIELAKVGQTSDAAASFERMIDLLVDGLTR
jgi:AcrR family transcriptional regulator